jgi:hypothetical protein
MRDRLQLLLKFNDGFFLQLTGQLRALNFGDHFSVT